MYEYSYVHELHEDPADLHSVGSAAADANERRPDDRPVARRHSDDTAGWPASRHAAAGGSAGDLHPTRTGALARAAAADAAAAVDGCRAAAAATTTTTATATTTTATTTTTTTTTAAAAAADGAVHAAVGRRTDADGAGTAGAAGQRAAAVWHVDGTAAYDADVHAAASHRPDGHCSPAVGATAAATAAAADDVRERAAGRRCRRRHGLCFAVRRPEQRFVRRGRRRRVRDRVAGVDGAEQPKYRAARLLARMDRVLPRAGPDGPGGGGAPAGHREGPPAHEHDARQPRRHRHRTRLQVTLALPRRSSFLQLCSSLHVVLVNINFHCVHNSSLFFT